MRRWSSPFLLALLLLLAGCAQAGEPAANTPSAAPSSDAATGEDCLRGSVTDVELVPIEKAKVSLLPLAVETETAADGSFRFCGLAPGRVQVHVGRLGYLPWSRVIDLPLGEELQVQLEPIPVLDPYVLVVPKVIYYTYGLSTIDTTTSRNGASLPSCSPCTWTHVLESLPDHVYWQATWQRNPSPVVATDTMYHVLRGGAPFEAGTDIGTGTMGKPWGFNYTRDDLAKNPTIKAAKDGVPLSGSIFCFGNPAWPCVDQRIHSYLSFFYDYETIPENYTALPT